jgi:hypothetical protein
MCYRRVGLFSVEGSPYENISKLAINVRNLGVKCEVLSAEDIKKRFPMFNLPPDWNGTLEPDGGFILANQALQAIQVLVNTTNILMLIEDEFYPWGIIIYSIF